MNVRGEVTIASVAADAAIITKAPDGFLVASGTRNATTGDGAAFIAAEAGKKVEYHLIKIQRVADTGDQTVALKSGSTTLDPDLIKLSTNQSGVVIDYGGKLKSGTNEAQYFNTATAITFDFWVLYRLVTA